MLELPGRTPHGSGGELAPTEVSGSPAASRASIVVRMSETSHRLLGAHEIRVRLGGISRQRVYQLTSRRDFPKPVADLAQGKIWLAADVEAWIAMRRTEQP
jgi:prophage regulatory protein